MKFSKVQRIEFLEEISEILGSITEETPRVEQQPVSQGPTSAEVNGGTRDGHSASSGTDSQSETGANSGTDSQSETGSSRLEGDLPELCVRCFNTWEGLITAGQFDLPSCEFDKGRGRKKCRYCSSRRSECVKVPVSIRSTVIRRKAELYRATLEGDVQKIERKQGEFAEAYFVAHGKVKGTLASEERKRRRERAAMRRAEQREQDVEAASIAIQSQEVQERGEEAIKKRKTDVNNSGN